MRFSRGRIIQEVQTCSASSLLTISTSRSAIATMSGSPFDFEGVDWLVIVSTLMLFSSCGNEAERDRDLALDSGLDMDETGGSI
jgi:hypothetical protein